MRLDGVLRAEQPRILEQGDLVQAEIHTLYGGQEAQVQMSVALGPVDDKILTCEAVARRSYEAGLEAIRPGVAFSEVVHAMERPFFESNCWSKTPLIHTVTFGPVGFTSVNRQQLIGTREEALELNLNSGIQRGEFVLREGVALELEPNACLDMTRVNIGGAVVVTSSGVEEYNRIPTRVHHIKL